MSSTTIQSLRRAALCGTPLVAVATADPFEFQGAAVAAMQDRPWLAWDAARGIRALNPLGQGVVAKLTSKGSNPEDFGAQTRDPVAALIVAETLMPQTVLAFHNAHRFLGVAEVVQAVSNLREPYKVSGRLLLLLGTSFTLPSELVQDVVLLDDPLPDDAAVAGIVDEMAEAIQSRGSKPVTPDTRKAAVDALRGLSAFAVEQVLALASDQSGLDLEACWERKRSQVNQTPGLSVTRDGMTFAELGGMDAAEAFIELVRGGGNPPKAVVFIDELDKAMAGLGANGGPGDSSGVAQDAFGVVLREMENRGWKGVLTVGPPGTGKTAFAKAVGRHLGVETLSLDLGAAKGSLVGQSEQMIRDIMRVIRGVASDRVLVVATCNKLDALPPELKRRMTWGTWYFDLPTPAERANIWKLNLSRYGLPLDSPLPDATDWTGAEIRNACELARDFGVSPAAVAAYIVPVAQSDPTSIMNLRAMAEGRFLSAAKPGLYVAPRAGAEIVQNVPRQVAALWPADTKTAS